MRKLVVLHVLPWITSGGVERRRLQLVRSLDPARYEQHVVSTVQREPLNDAMRAAGATLHLIEGPWRLGNLDALAAGLALVADLKPDIIHGAVFEGMTYAAVMGYLGAVPHIVIEETSSSSGRSWRGDMLLSLLSAISHKTVAISPNVARYVSTRSRVAPEKLEVITNGVSFPAALSPAQRAAARARWSLPDDAIVIGSAGRVFNDCKRFSDLIDAVASLDHPDLFLLIAGAGPDLEQLRARAAETRAAARIIFAGYVADTSDFYGVLDVFALVSAYEGFGLVIPEAMGVGLPVIGTRVDAIPDIIVEGQTGLLVPPCDPLALANAVRWMMEHPAQRAALGEAGRIRAFKHFSSDRYVEDVRVFYESLVDEVSP